MVFYGLIIISEGNIWLKAEYGLIHQQYMKYLSSKNKIKYLSSEESNFVSIIQFETMIVCKIF